MKEKNEPMLFVNSISVYREESKKNSSYKLHRLDDIKALLRYNKIVTVEVQSLKSTYIGIVIELNEFEITLLIEEQSKTFILSNILNINIIDTK